MPNSNTINTAAALVVMSPEALPEIVRMFPWPDGPVELVGAERAVFEGVFPMPHRSV